ncbi:hypothetical protein WG66_005330 [Moniliophthora roreri]|nr:hypothetical protein WG66_005330 [Moniliophthora roreri]
MTNPRVFVDDNSTNFLRGNDLSCARNKFVLKLITTRYSASPSLTDSQMSNSVGSLPSGHRAQTQDIRMLSREHYGNKAHHRIVMEDAGCPLQDVRNLRTVIACIGKASTGLSIMFSAGMVHRDISTGNLLVSEVDGELRCKITDLEYAKKVGASSQSPQDIKMGTPYFMALEIWRGKYLFRPERPENKYPRGSAFLSMLEGTDARLGTSAAVRYNFLHDLESLFWILMYFLFVMHPVDDNARADSGVEADDSVEADGDVEADDARRVFAG